MNAGFEISLAVLAEVEEQRGLDNAGKTTIVKRIMNEDVNTVSPTLGFIIKTIDHGGYVLLMIEKKRMRCNNQKKSRLD